MEVCWIAVLTCISAVLCLARTWHVGKEQSNARLKEGKEQSNARLKEGKEQSNARLKEGRNGFICIKHSRLGFPALKTSQS